MPTIKDFNKRADYLEGTKEEIRQAINDCGIDCSKQEPFRSYPEKIKQIQPEAPNTFKYKGEVETYEDLPVEPKIGDTYDVRQAFEKEGVHFPRNTSFFWSGIVWRPLGAFVDTTNFYTKVEVDAKMETVNEKIDNHINDLDSHVTLENKEYWGGKMNPGDDVDWSSIINVKTMTVDEMKEILNAQENI